MAFEKVYREEEDESPEYEYLHSIGYKNTRGTPITNLFREFVKDREKNYYMILTGCTNPNQTEGRTRYFYVLCLDGKPISLEVIRDATGTIHECNYEVVWKIIRIKYPKEWNPEEYKNLREIITEAFMAETYDYDYGYTPETVKNITVDLSGYPEL